MIVSTTSGDFFTDWVANFVGERAERGEKEIVAIIELLQVAEQVIASSVNDFDVKRKYLHVRNLVAKNVEQERNRVAIQKPVVQEDVQIVKMHQDVQVSKLIEIQSKVAKLKASIEEFNQYISNMYSTLGEATEYSPTKKSVIPTSPAHLTSSLNGDSTFQTTASEILSLLQQTHQSFANLQLNTRTKLHTANTLTSELSESNSKLSKIESELDGLLVETNSKNSKHALDIKQIQRENTKQIHSLQNELLAAKSNNLRNLNSSSTHERAITSLTTEYEIKLAESSEKIAHLENKVHEFDAIAKVLDIPSNSDVTSKVVAQSKALQEAQKYSQELISDRAKLRAQLDSIKDSNRSDILQLREQFLDVQSRAQLTLQTLEVERKSNVAEKEKLKKKINELTGIVRISEEEQRELENTTNNLKAILLKHSNT